jgi:hypothetical protein
MRVLNIFVSYAREDEELMRRVVAQLATLVRDGAIEIWTDGRILPGAKWRHEILDHLLTADIVLLLISEDFLNSMFCMEVEFEEAMERQDNGKAVVVPVILRHCLWQSESFGMLQNQVLPQGGKPVKDDTVVLESRLTEVATGIGTLVASMRGRQELGGKIRDAGRRTVFSSLCNRSRQDALLEARLLEHSKLKGHRPFLCLVHGDAYERHDLVLERLRVASLKRILDLRSPIPEGNVYRLRWPPEFANRREAKEMLLADLAIALGRNRENIATFLQQHEHPVILYSEVLTREWQQGGSELTKIFLDFWNGWPHDLPAGRMLIVCLFLKYERGQSAEHTGAFEYSESALAIRSFLSKLKFSRYEGLGGVVLPELEPISEQDVVVWGSSVELMPVCTIRENIDEFERDVAAIYRTEAKRKLPMERLKPHLDTIVTKYWRGKRI